MLDAAKKYVLDFILENEEVKKFPKDFVTATMQWIRSWFLKDDPISTAIVTAPGNEAAKKIIIEQKLPVLLENEQFKKEMAEKLADFKTQETTMKNVITGSTITVGGNFRLGDEHIQAGGNVHVGDIHYHGIPPTNTTTGKSSPDPEIARNLRSLIASARTGEVFKKLLDYTEQHATHLQLEVNTLSARWEDLGRNERLGIISRGEANMERNQINSGLLDLLGRL
ncbi:MAG: hypothetical protein NW218_15450 [Saprospiraceae bacterium]|nr:hypothetical protein [Saprospiraceae bacterium]